MTRSSWRNLELASLLAFILLILGVCVTTQCLVLYVLTRADPGTTVTSLLANLTTFADVVQALVTVFAVILGGIWTLVLFQSRRGRHPRLAIEHNVTCRNLPNGKYWLPVSVIVTNQSEVFLMFGRMDTWIQSALPYDDEAKTALDNWKTISEDNEEKDVFESWEVIALREHRWEKNKKVLEPGESHQFWFDFLIDPGVKTFRLYTHIREVDDPKLGWTLASLHDMTVENGEPKIVRSEYTKLAASKSGDKN